MSLLELERKYYCDNSVHEKFKKIFQLTEEDGKRSFSKNPKIDALQLLKDLSLYLPLRIELINPDSIKKEDLESANWPQPRCGQSLVLINNVSNSFERKTGI